MENITDGINWTPLINQLVLWQAEKPEHRFWTVQWEATARTWRIRIKEYVADERYPGCAKYCQMRFFADYMRDSASDVIEHRAQELRHLFAQLEAYGDVPNSVIKPRPDQTFEPRR